jgi:hypothetical protein
VTSVPEPSELLSLSRGLLLRFDPEIAGLWPRASALLARQALENALDRYWSARSLALQACSTHAQLICLAEYLEDEELAARVRLAWAALSDACHHHAYELAPTAAELEGLLDVVEAFVGTGV